MVNDVHDPDFRRLFEAAPGSYLVLSPALIVLAATDAYLRSSMTTRAAIVGRGIFDVFPDNPDDPGATGVANLRASLLRVLSTGAHDAMAVQKYDVQRPESEGGGFEERFWSPINSPVHDADRRVVYILHAVEDVTEFVKLRQLGTRQQQLTELMTTRTAQMEVEILTRAQQLQEANKRLREAHEELEGRVAERTRDLSRANDELVRQVSERRKAEEQLRQAQKMDAVGKLAGGVAHDFNNLLSVVMSYTDFVLMDLRPGDPHREDLAQVKLAAEHAAALTRQLLAFSRQQVMQLEPVDLNAVVSGLEGMLRRLIGEDIALTLALRSSLDRVSADPRQIEQVLMNLAVNARDAMPDGGKLTIETAHVELDDEYAATHPGIKPGRHVLLAVSDSGAGIDAETQARVFEPFFTTKPLGKGTGLGLSTVLGIVQQSGGSVGLYSVVGHGTTIKVYLPRLVDAVDPVAAAPDASLDLDGTETILLVEDDDLVRGAARRSLRLKGYTIFEAHTPDEAILLAQRYSGEIALMITDVVMPGMNGRALAERMAVLRPEIKIIYMSGYTDDAVVRHGVIHGNANFIQKPFTPDGIARKVREVLGPRRGGRSAG
jgi:signal transduction histidine kinase/ActR/RegA family two-component response regulator